ncbi:MAG: hypothetical protein HN377_02770 [Alphaproteobacteria bacterium]|jgi:hypothetical protein|nr:hypothetical protein [Alphaproteobacteria bacterium]MBT7941775.1 hypothetical protein [Alphaproteobacteria bacterium]
MTPTPLPEHDLTEDLKTALDYWRALGGEDLACNWEKFDLFGIPLHLIPTTMVIDMHPDMDDNTYRFWGTMMTRIHGADMTGKSPYDLEPKDLARAVRENHTEILETLTWTSNIYTFIRHSGVNHKHCTMRLPLSGDGKTVHQIVVIVDLAIADPEDRRDLLDAALGNRF